MPQRISRPRRTAAAGLGCLLLFATSRAPAADPPRLTDLVRQAKVVAIGRVTAVEDLDHGRLRIHTVTVDEELKPGDGASASVLRVVSVTDEPGAVVAETGASGVAFTQPLRRNSYLDANLPDARAMYQFVGGRAGWLAAPAERLEAVAAPVRRLVGQSKRPAKDAAARAADRRALVFEMIAAPHPQLVANGVADLSTVANLAASLSDQETAILASTLHDAALPTAIRAELIDEIAALDLRRLIEALQGVSDPALQESAWAALRKLDAPVPEDEVRHQLAAREPRSRLAAARELLERDGDTAIALVAPAALRDADEDVRLGVIEALGKTQSPAAVPTLEGAFAGDAVADRQAAARALREIGGEPAADALHRLAFAGPIDAQRYAVVLLTLEVGPDDRRVRDVVARHPDAKVQEILEHGLEVGHGH